jgi:hypothetical protein
MDVCRQFRPQGECEKGSLNHLIETQTAADLTESGMFLPALPALPASPGRSPEFAGARR